MMNQVSIITVVALYSSYINSFSFTDRVRMLFSHFVCAAIITAILVR